MRKRFFCFLLFLILWQHILSQATLDIEYFFPIPNTNGHPKETVIILRYKYCLASQIVNISSFIKVKGKISGQMEGKTVVSTDEQTIIFKPAFSFIPGEKVSVQLNPVINGYYTVSMDTTFEFTIMLQENSLQKETKQTRNNNMVISEYNSMNKQVNGDPVIMNGVSVPSDFPYVNITVNDNPDSGYVFLNTSWNSYPHYSMILDNTGAPIWYIRTRDNRQDLKVQPDGRLTMSTNIPSFHGFEYIAMDTTYTVVDTFHVPPGYYGDEHELQVLENGHYLLIAKNDSIIDMSQLIDGGHPQATVVGNSVVEMDANDNPVFIWRSWDKDHFNILDAVYENLLGTQIDYVHMNAIDVDYDGHILISSRHMSEITKINRQNGEVIWRLGGENDYFNWKNDNDRISYQHDIRALTNGNYTIFDNGNYHQPQYSRAIELAVNTTDSTVTVVWEYPKAHNICTGWMGNAQRLPNGNTAICWGDEGLPKLTEVQPNGSKTFELNFIQPNNSYRSFRFPWRAKAAVSYMLIEPRSDRITLLFNKFGDSDVIEYRIYGGTSPNPNQIIATTSQPFIHLFSELQNKTTYYFRVTAINSQKQESGFSNEEEVYINWIEPGEEMVCNGDFSEGFDHWNCHEYYQAQANWIIEDEKLHIQIHQGGNEIWLVQMTQSNIRLFQGKTYLFEFDAYTDTGRTIEMEVTMDGNPWTNYSQRGYTWLTTQKTHYAHEFIMERFSDFCARIQLNVGQSNHDVFVDNISLKEAATNVLNYEQTTPTDFALLINHPNPFNSQTTIQYTIPIKSRICLTIYNLLGKEVRSWQFNKDPGIHIFRFNAENFPSGIYFYQLQAQSENRARQFQAAQKLLLIK